MSAPWSSPETLKSDCRWFRGDVPCKPHKEEGVHCVDEAGRPCYRYEQRTGRVLVIKLGAIGDVIRTTPLLHRLRHEYPQREIWWLTLTPEILPRDAVDVLLPFTPQALALLRATPFNLLLNLDKDREACALAATLDARTRKGFTLRSGRPAPADGDAAHKYMTGVFDDLNRSNTKSYVEEIFEMCGFRFAGERYMLDPHTAHAGLWKFPRTKPIVGLNTGCGGRWVSRLWPEENWVRLAKRLKARGFVPVLLGGEQEHRKNLRIARRSGARYPGHFPLPQFISLVDQCHLVVTAVTMAMHITIGLGKKIVLFNNIFNRHEFELYGLGTILEPEVPCTCFYSPVCPNECMRRITVDRVFTTCLTLLDE